MKAIKMVAKSILSSILEPDTFGWVSGKLGDTETLVRCWVDPIYWESVRKLRTFKDKHKGERCFIIGNGPSLRRMDLSCLKGEITFGLNRIYLLFDKLGFSTTYYVSVNPYVIEQCANEINKIRCSKFIRWDFKHFLQFTPETVFVRSRSGPIFCSDLSTQGVWEGATVTYVAMQLAYYMGFSEVVLIGVDHSFKTKGEPHKLVVSEGEDPNHFDPNYFGKGYKWQLPDLATSEKAYTMAKEVYLCSGRKILDATVDGKLTVFPKVRFDELIRN